MRRSNGIREVAKHAGVSSASVSRALNRPELVRPETLRRIRDAMSDLNFYPDAMARAFVTGSSKTVGSIVPTIDNSMFSEGINALQDTLVSRGYMLLLANSGYNLETEKEMVRALVSRGVDGLVLRGEKHDREIEDLLGKHRIPCVTVGRYDPAGGFPTIGVDNRKLGRIAMSHLIELGHHRIAQISAVTDQNDRAVDRVQGMAEACSAAGRSIMAARQVDYALENIRQTARELIDGSDGPPTAVCCSNDIIAYGVLFEAVRMGLSVPRDLSIIGIGNLDLSRHVVPGLTTVMIPTRRLWARAGEILIDLLCDRETVKHVEFDVELVVRDSTKSI